MTQNRLSILLGAAACALLTGCGGGSDQAAVVNAVVDWHAAFVARPADSCNSLTKLGRDQLQSLEHTPTCPGAAAALLATFTASDRQAYQHVKVNSSAIVIEGQNALVPEGALTYSPAPAQVLALSGPLTLTRVGTTWRLNSVVYLPEH